MSSSSHGGAINDESTNNLLIEGCTFEKCTIISPTTFLMGGAIYVDSSNCVLNKVCGVSCVNSDRASFSYVGYTSSSQTINTVHLTSIAYCVASSDYTMCHKQGYIDIKSVNISHNKAKSWSALNCRPSSTNGGIYGTTICYSSFTNNTALYRHLISISYNSPVANQYVINNSNIIENSGDLTIHLSYGELTIRKTCIMKNKDSTAVFYLEIGSKCTLIHCSIDDPQKVGSGPLDTSSIGKNSFIHGLTFISTGDCVNSFDTIDGVPLIRDIEGTQHFSIFVLQKRIKRYLMK